MSTEQLTFEEQVAKIYEQYRHSELETRLEDVADSMERTILQRILAEEFLQTDLGVDPEVKDAVKEGKALLAADEYEELANVIDTLERDVQDQERQVSNEIHAARIEMRSTVNGMQRLNERVERVSEVKLQAIHELLEDWDWESNVYRDDDASLEELKQNAAEYGRELRQFFEDARSEIFGPYEGTPLEPIVDGLLSKDRLTLDDLTDEQRAQLADSDLAPYVGLSLS